MGETKDAAQPPPAGTWAKLKTLRNRIWRRLRKLRRRKERPRWTEAVKVPACPEGWIVAPPDFVGIGAQRSGTSWWYAGIEAQPQVVRVPKRRKELHYFNRFWEGVVPPDMASQYESMFPRPPGSLAGEWTPRYLYDYWSIPLLREAAPETRLLVLLRDPVARYRSGLAFAVNRARRSGSPTRSGVAFTPSSFIMSSGSSLETRYWCSNSRPASESPYESSAAPVNTWELTPPTGYLPR